MKFDQKQMMNAGDMSSATLTTIGLDIQQLYSYAIGATFSGTPSGTFILQVSTDAVLMASGSDPAANVVNWYDYTDSSETISASGNFMWNVTPAGYRWVRLKYTKSGGGGSLSVYFDGKG